MITIASKLPVSDNPIAAVENLEPSTLPDDARASQEALFAPLTYLGAIDVAGSDAATFLHAQLSNDVTSQTDAQSRLTGYCTPKGRLIATMLQLRLAESTPHFRLLLDRALTPQVAKRLSMYVLRAKAKVVDSSGERALFGLTLAADLSAPFTPPKEVDAVVSVDGATITRVRDAGRLERYLIDAPLEHEPQWSVRLSQFAQRASESWWRLCEIRAGVPHVGANTTERFVPQMINFELLDGVNFRKGCYPGQEVVARSQYLGKLKRRMFFATLNGAPCPKEGADVLASVSGDPVGTIVNAQATLSGRTELLIETTWTAIESSLFVEGVKLDLGVLPYDVPRETSAA